MSPAEHISAEVAEPHIKALVGEQVGCDVEVDVLYFNRSYSRSISNNYLEPSFAQLPASLPMKKVVRVADKQAVVCFRR